VKIFKSYIETFENIGKYSTVPLNRRGGSKNQSKIRSTKFEIRNKSESPKCKISKRKLVTQIAQCPQGKLAEAAMKR
jgi:hypothetical protein